MGLGNGRTGVITALEIHAKTVQANQHGPGWTGGECVGRVANWNWKAQTTFSSCEWVGTMSRGEGTSLMLPPIDLRNHGTYLGRECSWEIALTGSSVFRSCAAEHATLEGSRRGSAAAAAVCLSVSLQSDISGLIGRRVPSML